MRSSLWSSNHPAVCLERGEEHALLRRAVEVEVVSSERLQRFRPHLAPLDAGDPSHRWLIVHCKYWNFNHWGQTWVQLLSRHGKKLRKAEYWCGSHQAGPQNTRTPPRCKPSKWSDRPETFVSYFTLFFSLFFLTSPRSTIQYRTKLARQSWCSPEQLFWFVFNLGGVSDITILDKGVGMSNKFLLFFRPDGS